MRSHTAFTLVELLVVMSIIVVLLAVTGPVVRGIMGGRNVTGGLEAISGYLAYARAQAVAQNTYVVVGFYQTIGTDDLQVASVISTSGTFNPASFYPPTPTGAAANYQALGKTIHAGNVTLVPRTSLGTQLQDKLPAVSADAVAECSNWPTYPSSNLGFFSFRSDTKPFKYCFLAFSSQGEAIFFSSAPASTTSISANLPFYSQLLIGLRATRGGSLVPSDADTAALTLDGGSGDIKTYRP